VEGKEPLAFGRSHTEAILLVVATPERERLMVDAWLREKRENSMKTNKRIIYDKNYEKRECSLPAK
jgi:hypothetical protein